MTIRLRFGSKMIVSINPLEWQFVPFYEKSSPLSVYTGGVYFGWLCLNVVYKAAPKKEKDWSDDDIIRQMKNLEKEVEAQKPAKTSGKAKRM